MKISLVIPCFNEEQSLKVLIPQLIELVDSHSIEFILVDNGSSDGTAKLFKQISNSNIITKTLNKNRGYGGGIKAGLSLARGEFIGWMHADLQYSIFEIVEELSKLRSDAEYIKGKRVKRKIFQNFISFNMSIFESVIFGTILYDINAQPTLFYSNFLNKLDYLPDDFSIDLHSFVIAKKSKLKITRFKVNFINRSYGKSTWNSGFNSVVKMSLRTLKYSILLRKNL